MPRVTFVKKARKDNPVAKRGESYYWWKFKFGAKHYSLTPPKRSQLTQSNFFSQMYDIEDEVLGNFAGMQSVDDLQSVVEDAADQIRALGEECQDNLYNMPESLQESPTGELLQSRIDECEGMAEELEGVDLDDYDGPEIQDDSDPPSEFVEWLSGKIEELQCVTYNGE
jgi:hypothetical protein